MLSGLDAGTPLPSPQKGRPRRGWVAAAVLAVVALGGTYLWQAGRQESAAVTVAADGAAASSRRAEPAPVPVPRKVDEAAPAAVASTRPAAVIETVAAAAAQPATPAAMTVPSKVAGSEAAAVPSARTAPPVVPSTPARTAARAPRPLAPVAEDRSMSPRPPTPRPASKEPALAAAGARSSGGNGRDSDVDLIAAMVDHLQGTNKPSLPAASASTRAGKGERPVTIAKLVRDCKRLGGAEAVQCRRQICDGYWGKAQACPARLAPAKALTMAKKS